MLKVAAFTGGSNIPGTRFRVRQYIEPLRLEGVEVDEFTAPLGAYPPANRLLRPVWGVASLASRMPALVKSYRYDLTLLQRELISTLATLESASKAPRIFDVDDAIWLYREGKAATRIAQKCQAVICGNGFLAQHFSRWNSRVTVIPTAVDTERFLPTTTRNTTGRTVIGWIGTSGNFKYLYQIEQALAAVLEKTPGTVLLIVSDARPNFSLLEPDRVEFRSWSVEGEVRAIQQMSVGIMPLDNSEWARGKCSFKMLQYMACGLPVVVSPVGMNAEVLAIGAAGIGACTNDDWVDALLGLLTNEDARTRMGSAGRQIVMEHYSVRVIAPRLASFLRERVA